ncbi:hypothetical protein D7V83_14170 [bacterium 0.1xD8-71]|nr:hypothetical protein D7V83_14170 [bacterium 0.1xD8-71]
MKFFLTETNTRNRLPYGINANRAVDVRYANRKNSYRIPNCCVVDMKTPSEVFFTDIITEPFLMVSREVAEVIEMYTPETIFKTIYLLETESEINATYFMPFVEEVECLSEQTKRSRGGTELLDIVLRQDAVAEKPIFRVAGFTHVYLIVRLDAIESMLRRGIRGIKLKELSVV